MPFMHKCSVLVVDDSEDLVSAIKEVLERRNYKVITAHSGMEALRKASSQDVCIALVDLVMPVMDGIMLLDRLKEIHPDLNAIIISAYGTVPAAVDAVKHGALDFITKPFDKDLLLGKLDAIRKTHELLERVPSKGELLSERYGFKHFLSSSPAMRSVFERAAAASQSDAPVLIVGETGTGKELLAKAIHQRSARVSGPLVAVNCGAIPKELMESELFGYKKWSFTGAQKDHDGLFVASSGGTIFLDEIGEMPKELQVKLLRVLEERRVRPIGHTSEIPVDIRVIAMSNRTLEELKGEYLREDLFFRLAVIVIEIPPLRSRVEDIPLLAEHFLERFGGKYSKNVKGLSEGVLRALCNYHFPGNVRELENLMEALVAVAPPDKELITERDLRSHFVWKGQRSSKHAVLSLDELERFALENALREAQGNKLKAAEMLGVSRDTLYRKLKQFGIK